MWSARGSELHMHVTDDVSMKIIMHFCRQFQVSLSQGDFTSLMKVLNENLSEGQAPPTTQDVKPLPPTTSEVEAAVTPSRACK